MATLPSPESVGPLEDQPIRRMGIGEWRPSTISEAGREEGAGFEKLGTALGDVAAQEQNRQNNLQVAQAEGTVGAAHVAHMSILPFTTDSSTLPNINDSFNSTIDAAAQKIGDPTLRAQFIAKNQPVAANLAYHVANRGRELDDSNTMANLDTNINSTMAGALNMPDDAAAHAMDGLNIQIDKARDAAVLPADRAVQLKQQVNERFVNGKVAQLYGDALTSHDYGKLTSFLGIHPEGWATFGGRLPAQGFGVPTKVPDNWNEGITFGKAGPASLQTSPTDALVPEVKSGLASLRQSFGQPFTITSTTGGEHDPNSFHYQGRAVDLSIAGMDDTQLGKLITDARSAGFTGFGLGATHLHIDMRPSPNGQATVFPDHDPGEGPVAGAKISDWQAKLECDAGAANGHAGILRRPRSLVDECLQGEDGADRE